MNELLSSSLRGQGPGETSAATRDALAWFDLGRDDREQAARLAPVSDQVTGQIIDDFYDHILRFDSAARKFTSTEQIERVKAGQKKYFKDLIKADFDDTYVAERRRIGRIHEQTGITPVLYVGAYAYYLNRLGAVIGDKMAEDPATAFKLFLTLAKIAHFDMALALETYTERREATIERQQREMNELPTPVLKLKPGLLIIPVVGALEQARARSLTVSLLDGIHRFQARAVVLDITGVAEMDSSVANHLIQAMQAARLMGARSVLTGVSSDVAQSLVKIGVGSAELNTAGDLESGILAAESILAR